MRTKRASPHVPVPGPPAYVHVSLVKTVFRPDLSCDSIIRSSNVGVCGWLKGLAPLDSDAAVVGGECETVSSLNCSRAEAETLNLYKSFKVRVKLNCLNLI